MLAVVSVDVGDSTVLVALAVADCAGTSVAESNGSGYAICVAVALGVAV